MALNNPNWYRAANRASRSPESQKRAAMRRGLRKEFQQQYGANWHDDPRAKAEYEKTARSMGIAVGADIHKLSSGLHPITGATLRAASKAENKARRQRRAAAAKAPTLEWSGFPGGSRRMGVKTLSKSKARAYKDYKRRSTEVDAKQKSGFMAGKKYRVVDPAALHAFNMKRRDVRESLAYWDAASRRYTEGPLGYFQKKPLPGASGQILMSRGANLVPGERYKRKGRKGRNKGVTPPQFAERQALLARARAAGIKGAGRMKNPELMAVLGRSNPSYRPPIGSRQYNQDTKAHYRAKHALTNGLALDNYGALALDNYGGLALENPVPFVGGVAANTGLLLVTGLAGGIGHAFLGDKVEGLLAKIPVVGERLMDLSIPEAIPVIGGMSLDNTIVGAVTGIGLIAAAQFLGRRTGMRHITEYGTALGTGVIIAGPVLDFAGAGSNSGDDLAGLALENEGTFGGLALENEGTFGDGMAYQIGSIVGDDSEYDQASLADAFYSGADFDVAEGQAILNGRAAFQQRFGHAPRRVDVHGGRRSGPSHLASRPGHRWGWLIKMIGFENVQKLAALPPQKRVSVLKQMQSSAVATFQQLMAEQKVAEIAAPELAPEGAQGADGVNGLFGAYGATVFGGAGL